MEMKPPDGMLMRYDAARKGAWTVRDAVHLLSRAQFGFTAAELEVATKNSLDDSVERLLMPQPESLEFQHAQAALRQTALATSEINDLKIWWLYRMWASANPLAEKMTLFWHNHFATSNDKVRSVAQMLAQNELIRTHGVADFKQLLHGMSRDAAMLVWLDGNANRKRHPNENFAREIMELFSLGVGHYSERDIQEAARAFTGWHVREGAFWFNRLQHDASSKTVFGKSGNFDGAAVVNLCLEQSACSRFLATKLLKTFVCPEPTAVMMDAVATRIRLHDYAMTPVLRELFSSQLFFDAANRRTVIKSPLDLVVGSLRSLAAAVKWPPVTRLLANLGQNVFEPPSVKGWEGGRLWINSSTILLRANFATDLASGEQLGALQQSILEGAAGPSESVVARLEQLLFGGAVDSDLHVDLAKTHQRSEGNAAQKLRTVLQLMLSLPEYHLH